MGQWVSVIGFGAIMPVFGCLAASSTQAIYGKALWNPPDLVQKWLDTDYDAKSRAAAFFAGGGLVVCQLAINTIDNAFSTGMDMAGLSVAVHPRNGGTADQPTRFPNFINIRRGAYIGLVLSIAMCPWQFALVSSYLHQRAERLQRLPRTLGRHHGLRLLGAPPQVLEAQRSLPPPQGRDISLLLFGPWGINSVFPPMGLRDKDEVDYYGTFTPDEALRLGISPSEAYEGISVEESGAEKGSREPKVDSVW
ncbi:hypothetical protein LTS09_011500 [Friedmanniomyces endolithicus]|nr:hypothetical protein LTS09_011500 [Friedmanniomyces endolithicus]